MGLDFSFGKRNNTIKFIRKYLQQRVKEKKTLNEQLQRLNTQLKDNTIDQHTYERLKDVLEINFLKQRDEALEKTFSKQKIKGLNLMG